MKKKIVGCNVYANKKIAPHPISVGGVFFESEGIISGRERPFIIWGLCS